jgi:hypothetical protein
MCDARVAYVSQRQERERGRESEREEKEREESNYRGRRLMRQWNV